MVHDEPIDYMLETSEDSVAALLSDTTDEVYEIITNNDNLKYIPLATKTTYGVVKVGDGLRVVNGVLNVIGGGGSGGSDITKLSELENDVGFITDNTDKLINYYTKTDVDNLLYDDTDVVNRLVSAEKNITTLDSNKANKSDLLNYYVKTDTYSKIEINELVSKIPKFGIEVEEDLDSIPEDERSTTTIYLVPKTDIDNNDYYDEVLWLDGTWERFGSVKVNLTDYYTKSESNSNFIDFTSIQNVSGRKNFQDISIKNIFYVGEKDDVLLMSASIDSLLIGNEDFSISFISNSRPVLYEGVNLTRRELAYLSDMPNVPTKLSQLENDPEFITQQTLELNYDTAAETASAISAAIEKIYIPTKLSELSTDTNNQRVSATEKATWNNKSDFSGNYNDLTNKPTGYLTAIDSANITGRKTFIDKTLEIAPTAGAQPTYIYSTGDAFRVDGISQFIELDDSKSSPIIRLLGYDIATKDDLKDVGVDTSDLVTTNTEQTITAKKTFEEDVKLSKNLLNKDGDFLIEQTTYDTRINDITTALLLQSSRRPAIFYKEGSVQVTGYIAHLGDIPALSDIYPVGSIYLTTATDTTGADSPARFFGGSWERLPDGYALWTASEGAGDTIDAGLPNITGSFQIRAHNTDSYPIRENTGAFTSLGQVGIQLTTTISSKSSTQKLFKYGFDANKSNDIYRDDVTTVQPPAIKVYAWKRIA